MNGAVRSLWRVVVAMVAVTACGEGHGGGGGATLAAMSSTGARWVRVEARPSPAWRRGAQVVSSAAGVFVVGGRDAVGARDDAWWWNGDAWRELPREGAPGGRVGASAVWTGDALCVWGGRAGRSVVGDGACWSPATGRWRPMSREGAPSARSDAAVAWDGHTVLLFGGRDGEGEALDDGYRYDPRDDRWTRWAGGPAGRWGATLCAAGEGSALLAGGAGEAVALGVDEAAVWRSFVWRTISSAGAPLLREGAPQAVVGDGVLRVGATAVAWLGTAGDGWVTRAMHPLGPRVDAAMVATPEGAVMYGGRDGTRVLGDGARYVAADDRWELLTEEGAPPPRAAASLAWDGRRLLVLWGDGPDGLRDDIWAL